MTGRNGDWATGRLVECDAMGRIEQDEREKEQRRHLRLGPSQPKQSPRRPVAVSPSRRFDSVLARAMLWRESASFGRSECELTCGFGIAG